MRVGASVKGELGVGGVGGTTGCSSALFVVQYLYPSQHLRLVLGMISPVHLQSLPSCKMIFRSRWLGIGLASRLAVTSMMSVEQTHGIQRVVLALS